MITYFQMIKLIRIMGKGGKERNIQSANLKF